MAGPGAPLYFMPDGGSGGSGAGYNIPISVSYARTDTTNPVFSAATNFFFSSPWASTGSNDQSARNTAAATATSAAAQGDLAQNAQSQTAGANAPQSSNAATLALPAWLPYAAGGAVLLIVAAIYFTRR